MISVRTFSVMEGIFTLLGPHISLNQTQEPRVVHHLPVDGHCGLPTGGGGVQAYMGKRAHSTFKGGSMYDDIENFWSHVQTNLY